MRFDYCVVVVIVGLFLESCVGLDNITTGCADQPECVRCGPKGCIKCPRLIVHPTRVCVDSCPFGHVQRWSTMSDYAGRICQHNGNLLGLSANALAVLTGIFTGAILCAVLISSAVVYARYRRKRRPQTSETGSEMDDIAERRDFLKRLETLRPHATTYLDMLNDTRRQIRELHADGDGPAISAYRPVVRDLAKVLLLLNRRADRAAVPEDWERLFGWAEKALSRYGRMSEQHVSETEPSPRSSTFKPGSSLQDLAVRNFDANYDSKCHLPLNPQWKFEYSLVADGAPASSEFDAGLWRNSKECIGNSLFLDDDFCQLGFRPQDEITTEL